MAEYRIFSVAFVQKKRTQRRNFIPQGNKSLYSPCKERDCPEATEEELRSAEQRISVSSVPPC
jgi:hypothetical protein